jgi:hypothetical protein
MTGAVCFRCRGTGLVAAGGGLGVEIHRPCVCEAGEKARRESEAHTRRTNMQAITTTEQGRQHDASEKDRQETSGR